MGPTRVHNFILSMVVNIPLLPQKAAMVPGLSKKKKQETYRVLGDRVLKCFRVVSHMTTRGDWYPHQSDSLWLIIRSVYCLNHAEHLPTFPTHAGSTQGTPFPPFLPRAAAAGQGLPRARPVCFVRGNFPGEASAATSPRLERQPVLRTTGACAPSRTQSPRESRLLTTCETRAT